MSGFRLHHVKGGDDPEFTRVYRVLDRAFGAQRELEGETVLARRLQWAQTPQPDGWFLRYGMVSVRTAQDDLAAVRDHSVIIPPPVANGAATPVVIHLSHVLVVPRWRRTGLAGWMRALPLSFAREGVFTATDTNREAAFTLVAEMEPANVETPARLGRLAAYEKAGFLAVDPARVKYFQPDFGTTPGITSPLPMSLIIRRVGREQEKAVDGAEMRSLVTALYRLYAEGCRAEDLAALAAEMDAACPKAGESVALVSPTQGQT